MEVIIYIIAIVWVVGGWLIGALASLGGHGHRHHRRHGGHGGH